MRSLCPPFPPLSFGEKREHRQHSFPYEPACCSELLLIRYLGSVPREYKTKILWLGHCFRNVPAKGFVGFTSHA